MTINNYLNKNNQNKKWVTKKHTWINSSMCHYRFFGKWGASWSLDLWRAQHSMDRWSMSLTPINKLMEEITIRDITINVKSWFIFHGECRSHHVGSIQWITGTMAWWTDSPLIGGWKGWMNEISQLIDGYSVQTNVTTCLTQKS